MPGPKPPAVPLSEAERQELLRLIRAHTTPQHYSFHAQILLLLADGHNAPEVARRLGDQPENGAVVAPPLAGAARECGGGAFTRRPAAGSARHLQCGAVVPDYRFGL
jgi:hypothetical protein